MKSHAHDLLSSAFSEILRDAEGLGPERKDRLRVDLFTPKHPALPRLLGMILLDLSVLGKNGDGSHLNATRRLRECVGSGRSSQRGRRITRC